VGVGAQHGLGGVQGPPSDDERRFAKFAHTPLDAAAEEPVSRFSTEQV
jgi:hypothetical protein